MDISDIEHIWQQINNGELKFPYKKYFIKNVKDLFVNLQNYNPTIVNTPFTIKNMYISKSNKNQFPINYLGNYVTFVTQKKDYNNIDIITDYFTEKQRLAAKRKDADLSVINSWYSKPHIYKLFEYIKTQNIQLVNTHALREAIYVNFKECTQFKCTLAFSVYKYFSATSVLDFSAGWGDRLIAAAALNLNYLGYDPNTNLQKGHNKIINLFGDKNKQNVIYLPFETSVIPQNYTCDLVFTSPPYFDFEIYTDLPGQSTTLYTKFGAWLNNFLFKSLQKAWQVLNKNGYMVIHIADVYNIKCCESMCVYITKNLHGALYCGVISAVGTESGGRHRPMWVFKKQ